MNRPYNVSVSLLLLLLLLLLSKTRKTTLHRTRDGENAPKKRFEKSRGIPDRDDKIHMKSGDTEREQQTSTHAKGKRIANRRN